MKKSFYFVRHAETNHNVNQVFDEQDIEINENGIKQSIQLQKLINQLPIATVCSSPLLRAQQTKKILLKDKDYKDIIIDNLKECPSTLWRLFLASESRKLHCEEEKLVQEFIKQVDLGIKEALSHPSPVLIIAHGGTYWALSHLFKLDSDRKVANCNLIEFIQHSDQKYKIELIM